MRAPGPRAILAAAIAALTVTMAGCQFPKDPEETLNDATDGTLRVGVVENPPWVILPPAGSDREPQGVEPELIRRFADEIDAEIDWVEGSESELVEAMKGFQLDIIAAGFARTSPWRKEISFTRPYIDTEIEFAVPPGEELDHDLEGVEVWVERSSPAAALLQQEEGDAIPVYYESLSEVRGTALLHTYEAEELGYESTDKIQRDNEHALAVPKGENAFIVELEHFLLDRGDEAEALLDAEIGRVP